MTGLLTVKERPMDSPGQSPATTPRMEERKMPEAKKVPWWAEPLCRCGLHSGKWDYVAEGNCKQLRVCARCENPSVRTKHQREWRYIRDGACEQRKICRRCGDMTGERTSHSWGSTYKPVSRHDNAHECLRCGTVEEWDDSSYDD